MRKESGGAATLVAVFLSVLLIGTPVDAAKSGAKCKKVGATEVTKGATYICTKSGKILKWVKTTATTTTATTTTTAATVTATSTTTTTIVSKTCAAGGSCKVGDAGPGGGIVFYDAGSTQSWGRYLEAAPNTWNGGTSDPETTWGCWNTSISGAKGTAVGTGQANTTAIVNGCTTTGIAARLADGLTFGGKSDWFLPSKDELALMYIVRASIGGFNADYYWSSSEHDTYGAGNAWGHRFGNGTQGENGKGESSDFVRPVRAFS